MLSLTAPTKINLTLEVLGKRADGYHEIRSVVQAIDLQDTINLELSDGIQFSCSVPELETRDNLVLKTVRLLQNEIGVTRGVKIELVKRIPEAAGLGGGSSDAATTLMGLSQLWDLDLPFTRLLSLAARTGSDVPFFLYRGAALMEGRGEKIIPIAPLPKTWFVVVKPSLPVMPGKTAQLYKSLVPAHFTSGQLTRGVVKSLQSAQPLQPDLLFNVFENVAFDLFPGLAVCRQQFLDCGAPWAHLAGSGPALYTMLNDHAMAEKLYSEVKGRGIEVYVASTVDAIIGKC